MKCPKCGRPSGKLFRDKPKGQRAKFVCLRCVPDELRPDKELAQVTEDIRRALV
jgi:hypothetical protein